MSGDAFEIHGEGREGPMVITCEHASARVPAPLSTSDSDRAWLETHWGYDIGAATVARRLADRSGSVAVLARYSRLVCDPNRDTDDPTWIRTHVEGQPLSFNQDLDAEERDRRARRHHAPYHAAVDRLLAQRLPRGGDVLLFSVHSFTPVFAGAVRPMELGVLFDRHAAVAERFAGLLDEQGFHTALNEPYSGMDGVIFAAQHHGAAHDVVYLELEVRQDLISDAAAAIAVADRVGAALERLRLRTKSR
ncbi:N-formylglutamate amidohydrolase [Pseudenhygromyxa sp. WMMC2535]|uniref:N-formylglutamate amidohydrolase n=1 Tax=Pseudenhygromyxa sp. WMMC2535 TaxID=2712867 RepID=UPI00155320E0|nr:N-formylglutamate amidohydrolase [Pseudenhygromyxa sp. WMMC2535]NVB39000.1 N-formylglutamate amidohydrolase [Pseudenhygromyxa sp. WMMC2535]